MKKHGFRLGNLGGRGVLEGCQRGGRPLIIFLLLTFTLFLFLHRQMHILKKSKKEKKENEKWKNRSTKQL